MDAQAECWDVPSMQLPPRNRPDPRTPGRELSQRHQWRRGPGRTVIADLAVRRPHQAAIERELDVQFPVRRRAAVLATPLGDNFFRVVRRGEWGLAKALLQQMRLRVGGPDQVMTAQELDAIVAIGTDYDADLAN